jgi:hypothetical protein
MKEGVPSQEGGQRRSKHNLLKRLALGAMMLGAGEKVATAKDQTVTEEKISPLKEMTPDITRDIEIWAQKDFFKTLDTLRYIAENKSVNGIMAQKEITKLVNISDEEIRARLKSIGIEFENLSIIPPHIAQKKGDSPEGSFEMGTYDSMTYLEQHPNIQAELDMGFHGKAKDDTADGILRDTYVYEYWLKDRIRELYQRYESIEHITINTVYKIKNDLNEIENWMESEPGRDNETGAPLAVMLKERTRPTLPSYAVTTTWVLKESLKNSQTQ